MLLCMHWNYDLEHVVLLSREQVPHRGLSYTCHGLPALSVMSYPRIIPSHRSWLVIIVITRMYLEKECNSVAVCRVWRYGRFPVIRKSYGIRCSTTINFKLYVGGGWKAVQQQCSNGNHGLSSHPEETKKVRFLEFLVSWKNWVNLMMCMHKTKRF